MSEERHVIVAIAVLVAALVACKTATKATDDAATSASATASASAAASVTASASASAPLASASIVASARASAPAHARRVPSCAEGTRLYALDEKAAPFCASDDSCNADADCKGKGTCIEAMILNDDGSPALSHNGTPIGGKICKPGPAAGDKTGEMNATSGKCLTGWVLAEEACHRPCTKDSDCEPPTSFCKKWEGKKLCARTGSLVVPND